MFFLMIVISVLIYLSVCAVLVAWIWRGLKRRGSAFAIQLTSSVLIVFALVAAPISDHVLGKFQFERMCESESGLRVFKTVAGVDGFRSRLASNDTPVAFGFTFVEKINSDGTITRYSRDPESRVVEERQAAPRARYVVEQTNEQLGVQVDRTEYVIKDVESNERIAQYVALGYRGGWLNRQLEGAHPDRSRCPTEPFNYRSFVVGVLQPKS